MKIKYFHPEPPTSQDNVILGAEKEFEELGIEFVNADPDLYLVSSEHEEMSKEYGHLEKPVVFLDRVDGCQVSGKGRWACQTENVQAVVKNYTYRPSILHNLISGRAHTFAMGEPHRKPPAAHICPTGLRKIKLGFGFEAYKRMDKAVRAWRDSPQIADIRKQYDISFVGTVSYDDRRVSEHRRKGLEAVKSCRNHFGAAGRSMEIDDWYEITQASKCVLCPWGNGEPTFREYEAIMLGAVPIRPETTWQTSVCATPAAPVHHDFSNLQEVVDDITDNYDAWLPIIVAAQVKIMEARKRSAIAGRLANIFTEAAAWVHPFA
jgi:hypothetical protein